MDSSQLSDNEDLRDIEELIKKELETESFLNKTIDHKLMIDVDNGNANIGLLDQMLFNDLQISPLIVDDQTCGEVLDIVKLDSSVYVQDNLQPTTTGELFEEIKVEEVVEVKEEDEVKTSDELKKLFKASITVNESNQMILRSFIPKDLRDVKSSSSEQQQQIECSKCCRQFVHEGGLHRHWDIHVGEILPLTKPENPNHITTVILCVNCAEVFLHFWRAIEHLKSSHVEIIKLSDANATVSMDEAGHESHLTKPTNDTATAMNNAATVPFPRPNGSLSLELIRLIHITKFYQCEFCESIFCHQTAALVHTTTHHPPSSGFQCNTCDVKKLTLKDLILHRRDECVVYKDKAIDSMQNLTRVWCCNVCFVEFQGLEQLFVHRHENNHFFPRFEATDCQMKFLCEMCLFVCPQADAHVDHYKEKHLKKSKSDAIVETSERIKKPAAAALSRGGIHQTSARPRQFLCEVCGKSYTQSSHLWQHLRFHQGVKPFECPEKGCARKFTIRPDLNDHIRKCHTGERPFLCTICNKRFLTGSVFYQHRLIHRGERRYGCEECGKRFYRADALKNHLRIHSGEKPHVCNVCSKAFRQRGDRDKHVKARHPDAPPSIEAKKPRVKSFGRGRVRNNTALYEPKPSAVERVGVLNEESQDQDVVKK